MAIAVFPYQLLIDHDSKKYDVAIPSFSAPKCIKCGTVSIDDVASEQIDTAFRRVAKLLTPEEIRQGRIQAGFNQQQEFAQCFGIGVSTLSRWETGAQIQQLHHDGMLRAFFAVPQMRDYLSSLHGLATSPASQSHGLSGRTSS